MSQKRKAKMLAVSLPPELHAAVKAKAGPEPGKLSAFVQGCLTSSPALLAEELRGLVKLIERGDTSVSVLAVEQLIARTDAVLRDLELLLRLREMLERFRSDVARRTTEAGAELAELAKR